ncbi:beta-propeller domain-containing protein [Candidatus Albibeggiatoa sp. nov. NOAA]|uniref:beta-propeller domain-containing protein n=1 Tax=Candidatus Albibeggiatoa sp. nov. NOAA TaxID=3162724 RepID=UPI0032FBF5BA|nr:beta-propeller domain-containing protein [Thiotrichaceae bacterium]
MKLLRTFLFSLLLLYGWQAQAWQVAIKDVDKQPHVFFSHEGQLNNLDVYLAWLNFDASESGFASWTTEGWVENAIQPISDQALNIDNVTDIQLAALDRECPTDERCVLALVGVEHGQDWTDSALWQQVHILPLSIAATQERFPGQTSFTTIQNNVGRGELFAVDDADGAAVPTAINESASPNADKTTGTSASVTTEKPDIFKLVGSQILYANSQAKRFQVIDVVGHPETPEVTASIKLEGNPSELYVINDYKILMQNDYEGKAFFTVFGQDTNGQLQQVDEYKVEGSLRESRRRNNAIYTVTQNYNRETHNSETTVTMLELQGNGKLLEVESRLIEGYPYAMSIFTDYLVVVNDGEQWPETNVQVYSLLSGLTELPSINVPGRIPSEFHVHVKDEKLHVVYEDRSKETEQEGSALAIYDLNTMQLLGQVGNIAPSEGLFATRFAGDKAYVVTYERTDPLWVIDISDATNPRILGELKIPGWSEKMFFNDDILFAVGIFDQPEPEEGDIRVRRASVSLFDVSDPTNPSFLDRYIPLAGEVRWSYTQATYDERALQLDWANQFAALPIESWETEVGSYLQMLSFTGNEFKDEGLIPSPVQLNRSLNIGENTVAALGDQALLTIDVDSQKVLAELELGANISWLDYQKGKIWAASTGQKGYSRLYQYAPDNLEVAEKTWSLPRGYNDIAMDDQYVVFFNYNPLAIQVLDLASGELLAPFVIEGQENDSTAKRVSTWYNRTHPLVQDGWFYLAEQRGFEPVLEHNAHIITDDVIERPYYYQQPEWILRAWHLDSGQEGLSRSLPGEPVGFADTDLLVTREFTEQGELRLNLLRLTANAATLVTSQIVEGCENYSGNVVWADDTLYVSCQEQRFYIQSVEPLPERPISVEPDGGIGDGAEPLPATDDIASCGIAEDDDVVDCLPVKPIAPEYQPVSKLIKFVPQTLAQVGEWSFEGYSQLHAASGDTVLMGAGGFYPIYADIAIDIAPRGGYYGENGCTVYQLNASSVTIELKKLDTCPYYQGKAMTENQVWMARGFEGIVTETW